MSSPSRRSGKKWRTFNEKVEALRLPEEDAAMLENLAERIALRAPHEIIEVIETFERAVHEYFSSKAPSITEAEMLGGEALQIHAIRAALGFLVPPGVTYHSTRELEPGRDIQLSLGDNGRAEIVRGRVGRRREDLLDLIGLDPTVPGREGEGATALFYSGGRAFRFVTHVVHVEPDGSSCLTTHTLGLESNSRRSYFRARLWRLVLFRAADDPTAQRREGVLVDLSAGGAGLACPFAFDEGRTLVLDICPRLYRSDLPDGACETLEEMSVPGRVVRRRQREAHQFFYHIEFEEMPGRQRSQLHRLVHQLGLTQNRRRYRRLAVDKPIEIRLPDDPPQRTRPATLSDLGAGGARVEVGRPVPGAEALVLRLQPKRYLTRKERRKKAVPGDLEVLGIVVAIRNAPHGGVVYHVDFRDMEPVDERQLLRIIERLEAARPA